MVKGKDFLLNLMHLKKCRSIPNSEGIHSPFPGWVLQTYFLSRPVTIEDIASFVGDEEWYVRETESGDAYIIHKFGLLEIHCIPNQKEIEVWYAPEKRGYLSDYLEALISTRFS